MLIILQYSENKQKRNCKSQNLKIAMMNMDLILCLDLTKILSKKNNDANVQRHL